MCRWLAYSGPPIFLDTVLFKPENSLIRQSLQARESRSVTNGDGFGVGWYGHHDKPGLNGTDEPHEKAILILSEPLDHIRDNWTEAPENSIVVAAENRTYVLPLPASD